jgi:hypothetical protein
VFFRKKHKPMVFEFDHGGVRYKTDETSALGPGRVIILPNGKPVKVTGWNKKIPMEPVVDEATDAQMSDTPEATAAVNKGSVLAHLVE